MIECCNHLWFDTVVYNLNSKIIDHNLELMRVVDCSFVHLLVVEHYSPHLKFVVVL